MKLIVFLFLVLAVGCTRVESGSGGASATAAKRVDPWPVAAADLARTPDLATARRVLNQLNSELDAQGTPLPMMSQADIDALAVKLNPSADEAKDWAAKAFTPMDANYLGECLFFQQVAASLDVEGQPVPVKAKAAFDWVCRQMYLRPWVMSLGGEALRLPPIPPQFALRRGYGSGIERESAFIALARQLGLSPVLIGGPGLEAKPRADGKTARGHFWAVGIHDGNDVILFDPWLGEPFPVKLNEAKADPKKITDWLEARNKTFPVRPEEIAASLAYSVVPMSAVTPRMKLLEEKTGAKLTVQMTPPIYAPPANVDPYTIPHGLGYFTPKDDGGYDTKPSGPEQIAYLAGEVEPYFAVLAGNPPELKNENARQQMRLWKGAVYKAMIVDQNFRERLQRGQFNEVVRQLGDLDRAFANLQERLRNEAALLRDWYRTANDAYDALALTNLPENASKRPEALAAANAVWTPNGPSDAAVRNSVAEVAVVDVAYLFALAKHEQAERSQTRYRRNAADPVRVGADWAIAKDAWARYHGIASKTGNLIPAREAHSKMLAERAATLAANPQEKP